MNKPEVGSYVKVVVRHEPLAAVFSPFLNKTTVEGPRTKAYEGPVVRLSWLTPDQFAMSTGQQEFPVRVINVADVVSVDGVAAPVVTEETIETKEVAGTKGNVYLVSYKGGRPFACTCPGFTFRRACRHVSGEPGPSPSTPNWPVTAVTPKDRPVAKKAKAPKKEASSGQVSKAARARDIYKLLKGDRKSCIKSFMELGMSQASAQTYFYNIKKGRN